MISLKMLAQETFNYWYIFGGGYKIDWRKHHVYRVPLPNKLLTMLPMDPETPADYPLIEIRAKRPDCFEISVPGSPSCTFEVET